MVQSRLSIKLKIKNTAREIQQRDREKSSLKTGANNKKNCVTLVKVNGC